MKNYQISEDLHNFCRAFENDLTKPQLNRFKELVHGIIVGKKANLSEIARQNRHKQKKTIRKQVEQYSNMLVKLPLRDMAIRKMVGIKKKITKQTPLYIDLVDVSKNHHKSMEKIGSTWDGSEGKPGKGYEMVDASIGLESVGVSLYRHMYSTKNLDYGSQVREIKKVLETMIEAWGNITTTIFVDSGGDNNKLVELFLEFECSFAIRMNVNRGRQDRIVINERGDEIK